MDSFAESLPLATLRIKYTTPQGDRWCQAVLKRGDPFAWEDFLNDRFSIQARPQAYVIIIDVDPQGASVFVSVFEDIARQVRDRLLLPNGYQPEEVWWFHDMPGSFFRVSFRDPHRLETPIWDPSKRLEEAEGFKYDPDIYEPEDEDEGWDTIVFYRKEVEFLSKLIWAIEAGGLEGLGGDEEIFRSIAKKIRSIVHLKPIEKPLVG